MNAPRSDESRKVSWLAIPLVVLISILRHNYNWWQIDATLGIAISLGIWFNGRKIRPVKRTLYAIGIGAIVAIGLTKLDGFW
jgi:hypothetical protein